MWNWIIVIALSLWSIEPAEAQWAGAPQWEEAINKAHKDLLHRSPRASFSSYSDCPDSPGNVEPPDQCSSDERWGPCGCYEPPFWPFDPIEVFVDVGYVVGRSMEIFGGAPVRKYVNFFLGVPYARIPMHERRFKPPEDPMEGWEEGIQRWRADYYRDACPQELWHYQDEFYEPRNFSENCLHMNIFMPNLTGNNPPTEENFYEVMVFVHGEDYAAGDAMMYAGHILARKEIIVITFNYRLGALGFLSTMDENSPGNYGLMDIIQVLKWVQKYIERFHGKRNEVTLVGHGSGAAAISLLLVSPKAYWNGRPLFHQVILMSGSDLCEWSFVDNLYVTHWDRSDPLEFAKDLGRNVGCDPDYGDFDIERMVECLRAKHFDEIVNGTSAISKKYGMMWGPFGPVVDGAGGILPQKPRDIRETGEFLKVPLIAGVCREEGAYLAENSSRGIIGVRMSDGLAPVAFRQILEKMIRPRVAIKNQQEVVGAIEFEYTFWAKPDNRTAVRQNLIDLHSDWVWGMCVDEILKYHMAYEPPVYMYEFAHRSEYEYLPYWMGVPHGRDLDYLFGHPFYNETLGNITGVVPEQQEWTIIDRNISDFMQQMWVNFTKYGVPTTEWTRNVTWYPLRQYNLSYLHIAEWSRMDINYRQSHYAFWRQYFPTLSERFAITTTPFPTPEPLVEYQIATWALFGVALMTMFIIAALGITLWRQTKSAADREFY